MKRSGTVAAINANRGMIAIRTEDDGFTIIKLLSDLGMAIGDAICWDNGYGLGSEVYRNLSQGAAEEVYV